MPREIIISTDHVAPSDRTEMWREFSSTMYTLVSWDGIDTNAGIEGTLEARALDTMVLKKLKSVGQECKRERAHIQRYGYDHYYLSFLVRGQAEGDYDGVFTKANVGDVIINDVARPSHRRTTKFSLYGATIPRETLEHYIGGRDLHGVTLPANAPATGLIRDYVQGLYSIATYPSSMDKANAAQETLAGLVANSVRGLLPQHTPEQQHVMNKALRKRMLHFIEQHLSDPSLSPETLQKRFNISRAHLYRVFEEDGGVAIVIRKCRLERAWRLLANTTPNMRSSKHMAHALGFSGDSQFIRAFRTYYGMTPQTVWYEKPALNLFEQLRKHKTA